MIEKSPKRVTCCGAGPGEWARMWGPSGVEVISGGRGEVGGAHSHVLHGAGIIEFEGGKADEWRKKRGCVDKYAILFLSFFPSKVAVMSFDHIAVASPPPLSIQTMTLCSILTVPVSSIPS